MGVAEDLHHVRNDLAQSQCESASSVAPSCKLPQHIMAFSCKALLVLLAAQACSLVSAGPLNNLLADLTGHNDGSSTCLADGQHACSHASSFTGFFPDAVAPAHADHFFPSISAETVSGPDAHQGDVAHLDQFDSSLLANRRPKMFVSFDKK